MRSDDAARAEALVAGAFARRYRYPPGFGGFTARARFGPTGEATATVAICGPGESAALLDQPGTDGEWLRQELRALARRLYSHDYAVGEGRFDKSLVDDPHPLGAARGAARRSPRGDVPAAQRPNHGRDAPFGHAAAGDADRALAPTA